MSTLREFLPPLTLDFAILGVVGGAVLTVYKDEALGFSFTLGALWMALNLVLLSLLIIVTTEYGKRFQWAIWLLACAKIPLAYCLLLWLLSRPYLAPAGIIAALAALPVVLVWRGLAMRGKAQAG
jgi:hypothetical protein